MEYKELYQWLVKCFVDADRDRDGRITVREFDSLCDVASMEPRRLGFAPPVDSMYASDVERYAARRVMFNDMDKDRSGSIGFDEFLSFTIEHIRAKVALLNEVPHCLHIATTNKPVPSVTSVKPSADSLPKDKKTFVTFVMNACMSRSTPEYHQLYMFLLNCFTEADTDFDGMVGPEDFDYMVERASSLPRKFGFAPTSAEAFSNAADRRCFRTDMFRQMDSTGDGRIGFDEWLDFAYSHIREKARLLNPVEVQWRLGNFGRVGFSKFLGEACRSTHTMEYKELYHWLLKAFSESDRDGDGLVNADEFDKLVDVTAAEPRRLGFAPSNSKMFANEAEKKAARKAMFDAMDTTGSGCIGFDEFLAFIYAHIREKVRQHLFI